MTPDGNGIIDSIVSLFTGNKSTTAPTTSKTTWTPTLNSGDNYRNSVIVRKANHTLYYYDNNGKLVWTCPIATGKNKGNKTKEGDCRTPVGKFYISLYETNKPKNVFGDNRFYRLRGTGFTGIGIHGDANRPREIGTNASHGCVRMPNDSISSFNRIVGTTDAAGKQVYILDENDRYKNGGKLIPRK